MEKAGVSKVSELNWADRALESEIAYSKARGMGVLWLPGEYRKTV